MFHGVNGLVTVFPFFVIGCWEDDGYQPAQFLPDPTANLQPKNYQKFLGFQNSFLYSSHSFLLDRELRDLVFYYMTLVIKLLSQNLQFFVIDYTDQLG